MSIKIEFKTLFLLLSVCVLPLCFLSCSDEEEPVVEENAEIEILSDKKVFDVYQESTSLSVEFSSTHDWISEVDGNASEWIKINPSQGGSGTHTLEINISENTAEDDRVGIISIKSGKAVEKITVNQEGNRPSIRLLQEEYIVSGSNGGTVEISLKSNIEYEMLLPDLDWISECDLRSLTESTQCVSVAPNDTDSMRECDVIFRNEENNLSVSAHIIQMPQGDDIVTATQFDVSSNGATLVVKTNVDYDFDVELNVAKWLKPTAKISDKILTIDVEKNTGAEGRSAVVVISGGNVKDEFQVYQNNSASTENSGIDDMPIEKW